MGWSCSQVADNVLERWKERCIKDTGSSNVYKVGNKRYFYQLSQKEYCDGSITGTIYHWIDEKSCRKVGSFRINGNGTIARGPAILKQLSP